LVILATAWTLAILGFSRVSPADPPHLIDADTVTAVRVEEDWSLTVGTPNANLSCPQLSVQMAADPSSSQFYQFHLNFQDTPSFVQGGLQLQAWNDSSLMAVSTSPDTQTMATPNELITWTQYLERDPSGLTFGISAASSTTWGDFSGNSFHVNGADSVLDNYSSAYSVQNSGITFGVNQVSSLVLVQVRVYYSDGTMTTNAVPQIAYAGN
jgi:hypothetical protein